MPVNTHQLSNNELWQIRATRWKARTDLLFLCRSILGFNDAQFGKGQGVQDDVHGPLVSKLQKFTAPPPEKWGEYDYLQGSKWHYKPFVPMYDLVGPRRTLILDSRGHLKTTINATAHAIQWALNYPDMAMAIFQATDTKAQSILRGIKIHFQSNPIFRELFPEHCPKKSSGEWGTRTEITSEARAATCSIREATFTTGAIEKGMAGYHFDVMKFSDIVEPTNVVTKEQIISVYESFQMAENLLVRPTGWIDVEGTRYNFGDTYGRIIEKEQKRRKEGKPEQWNFYIRGCYKKAVENPQFSVEELDEKDLLDAEGHPVPWWPQRWTFEELDKKRADNPYIFGCQQRNNPLDDESQHAFPLKNMCWTPRTEFDKVPISFHTVTVDTADTQNARSKFTAITVVGWSQSGRAFLHDVRHGRFLPDEIIFHLFDINKKYRPLSIKIEDVAFVRGLMPSIYRAQETGILMFRDQKIPIPAGTYLPIEQIKRDTEISKTERILNTLQPWYMSGELRFVKDGDDPPAWWEQMMYELSRFPYYEYNDIIDALADQFQGREYFGRNQARAENEGQKAALVAQRWQAVQQEAFKKFTGETVDYDVPRPGNEFFVHSG